MIDPISRTVKVIPTKNEPSHRRRHSSVFFGRTLLVFGGFNGNYFDDFYCLTLHVTVLGYLGGKSCDSTRAADIGYGGVGE